ncbi:hypothetical protein NDU88_005600 [Pleurodeles waltl]|uniref:Uncharacterized protein n=1 Tax=Pleurodeles waltl TaxID=8319 RepID=A0AAV7L9V2_PLEWA|nr:hypothetical protein NDU88_005600 [Pleurodeles waltl]
MRRVHLCQGGQCNGGVREQIQEFHRAPGAPVQGRTVQWGMSVPRVHQCKGGQCNGGVREQIQEFHRAPGAPVQGRTVQRRCPGADSGVSPCPGCTSARADGSAGVSGSRFRSFTMRRVHLCQGGRCSGGCPCPGCTSARADGSAGVSWSRFRSFTMRRVHLCQGGQCNGGVREQIQGFHRAPGAPVAGREVQRGCPRVDSGVSPCPGCTSARADGAVGDVRAPGAPVQGRTVQRGCPGADSGVSPCPGCTSARADGSAGVSGSRFRTFTVPRVHQWLEGRCSGGVRE